MTWFYSQQFLISINGSYVLLEHTAAGLHTMPFSLEASGSRLGSIFGEAGHPCGVNFLFGWPLTTGVGQLIAWPNVGFLTRQHARFVIRPRKIFNASSSHVCSPDRFEP